MPLLTIASASCNSPEWAELFIKSVRKFTTPGIYEIIVVDNGSLPTNLAWLREQRDIILVENDENRGHGTAIDQAVKAASGRYVCILDIDAHVQRDGWAEDIMALYYADPLTRLVGCIGPDHKPLHPPLFFFERDFIREHNLSFAYCPEKDIRSTDTAQLVYWQILDIGYGVERLEKGTKTYDDFIGDEIWIAGKPTIAHMWYGVRFQENGLRPKMELDGYSLIDHIKNKRRLFAQPLVREILENA